MKNADFWDINPSSYLAGSTLLLRYIAQPVNAMYDLRSSRPPSLGQKNPLIHVTLMEATRSSETSVLTRATRNNIPEDGILHSNFKFYSINSHYRHILNHPKITQECRGVSAVGKVNSFHRQTEKANKVTKLSLHTKPQGSTSLLLFITNAV
jgi:hypothetical protein